MDICGKRVIPTRIEAEKALRNARQREKSADGRKLLHIYFCAEHGGLHVGQQTRRFIIGKVKQAHDRQAQQRGTRPPERLVPLGSFTERWERLMEMRGDTA